MSWFSEHFIHQSARKRAILYISCLTLLFAVLVPDRQNMLSQFWYLQVGQNYLLRDFFEIAGPSATFLNAAAHSFLAYFLMSRNERSNISGLQVAALGIYLGHSFFGSTILSSIPIIAGVVLYAHWSRQSYKVFTTVSLFAIATSPIVTFVGHSTDSILLSLPLAILVGITLGFISPPLAEQFLKFHHGLTLYNYGFTTGIVAMFFALIFPYMGRQVERVTIVSHQLHFYPMAFFLTLWTILFVLVLLNWKNAWSSYPKLLKASGRTPDDFVTKFGTSATLLNMCLNTGIYFLFLLFLKEPFNGPVLGGLLSIMGFSAFGKHPRNSLPVSAGVTIAALLLGASLTDVRFQLALLFGTGLAPISGYYGLGYGILAGFIHYNLTSVTFAMHQGMTLYNNGYSTGFVAAFLAPIIDTIQDNNQFWLKKMKTGLTKKHVNRKE